jgi:hypothetical protein
MPLKLYDDMVLLFSSLVLDIFHAHLVNQNDINFDIDVHKYVKVHYKVYYIELDHDYPTKENLMNE